MTVASCSYVCMCVWCQIAVPVGRLSKEDLQPRLSVHQGIPATASILAFEPVQRVLAVASLYVILTTFVYPFANKSALYDDEQFCIIWGSIGNACLADETDTTEDTDLINASIFL